jgi:hypothetical protein
VGASATLLHVKRRALLLLPQLHLLLLQSAAAHVINSKSASVPTVTSVGQVLGNLRRANTLKSRVVMCVLVLTTHRARYLARATSTEVSPGTNRSAANRSVATPAQEERHRVLLHARATADDRFSCLHVRDYPGAEIRVLKARARGYSRTVHLSVAVLRVATSEVRTLSVLFALKKEADRARVSPL